MLAQPHVFWNESLPFFAKSASGQSTKDFGDANSKCILVQYPQYFSNVFKEDYLDNKNSGYYVLWQTLRDCSKTITSSGTNGIYLENCIYCLLYSHFIWLVLSLSLALKNLQPFGTWRIQHFRSRQRVESKTQEQPKNIWQNISRFICLVSWLTASVSRIRIWDWLF